MIVFASGRCDVIAFYSKWLLQRIKDGKIYTRNPYNSHIIYAYSVCDIDTMVFCTKNPIPILKHFKELDKVHPYFFITITPYKEDIEKIKDKRSIIEAVKSISCYYGINSVALRYDPIFLSEEYTKEYHYKMFRRLLQRLQGYIDTCVISFIDLYDNVRKNGFLEVSPQNQKEMVKEMVQIAKEYNITIKLCAEDESLIKYGCSPEECISYEMLSKHLNQTNLVLEKSEIRRCNCVKTRDIGVYSSCPHLCSYCYANGYSKEEVLKKYKKHNPMDLCIDGNPTAEDEIKEVNGQSIFNRQLKLELEEV